MRRLTSIALVGVGLAVGCGLSVTGAPQDAGGQDAGGQDAGGRDAPDGSHTGEVPPRDGGGSGGGDGGDGGGAGGSDAQTDANAGDGGSAPCPTGKPGPVLVEAVGGGFCIDATEVTNAQYRLFFEAANKPAQPAYCAWNTSFRPGDWSTTPPYATLGPNVPVRQVDWCDAYSYCAWAGKRLCGARQGGSINSNDFASPAQSQWQYACSAGGQRRFPYGDTYSATACFGEDHPQGGDDPTNGGSLATCTGGFPGLFDMSGNVWEWEDGCTGTSGANDQCRLRGGSSQRGESELRCDTDNVSSRDVLPINGGIRCCSP